MYTRQELDAIMKTATQVLKETTALLVEQYVICGESNIPVGRNDLKAQLYELAVQAMRTYNVEDIQLFAELGFF